MILTGYASSDVIMSKKSYNIGHRAFVVGFLVQDYTLSRNLAPVEVTA